MGIVYGKRERESTRVEAHGGLAIRSERGKRMMSKSPAAIKLDLILPACLPPI